MWVQTIARLSHLGDRRIMPSHTPGMGWLWDTRPVSKFPLEGRVARNLSVMSTCKGTGRALFAVPLSKAGPSSAQSSKRNLNWLVSHHHHGPINTHSLRILPCTMSSRGAKADIAYPSIVNCTGSQGTGANPSFIFVYILLIFGEYLNFYKYIT